MVLLWCLFGKELSVGVSRDAFWCVEFSVKVLVLWVSFSRIVEVLWDPKKSMRIFSNAWVGVHEKWVDTA